MKESVRDFLYTFFNPGEEVCLSPNKYGHYSIPLEMIEDNMTLTQHFMDENKMEEEKQVNLNQINLCAINPIKGTRSDGNVTHFRSFMLELDNLPLPEQKKYIEDSGIPYSVCVFSGSKSLHYGIVLDEDLPNIDTWRTIAQWILNILDKADQQNKNPSRSIRFPDSIRAGTDKTQVLLENRGRVGFPVLLSWLSQYPHLNPVVIEEAQRANRPVTWDSLEIPGWVISKLEEGPDGRGSRNKYWFQMAMEFAKRSYTKEQIIDALNPYFSPQRDFGVREWRTIITSAITRVQRGVNG